MKLNKELARAHKPTHIQTHTYTHTYTWENVLHDQPDLFIGHNEKNMLKRPVFDGCPEDNEEYAGPSFIDGSGHLTKARVFPTDLGWMSHLPMNCTPNSCMAPAGVWFPSVGVFLTRPLLRRTPQED